MKSEFLMETSITNDNHRPAEMKKEDRDNHPDRNFFKISSNFKQLLYQEKQLLRLTAWRECDLIVEESYFFFGGRSSSHQCGRMRSTR